MFPGESYCHQPFSVDFADHVKVERFWHVANVENSSPFGFPQIINYRNKALKSMQSFDDVFGLFSYRTEDSPNGSGVMVCKWSNNALSGNKFHECLRMQLMMLLSSNLD